MYHKATPQNHPPINVPVFAELRYPSDLVDGGTGWAKWDGNRYVSLPGERPLDADNRSVSGWWDSEDEFLVD